MTKVKMHEAKPTLSQLVDRVAEAFLLPLKPIVRRPGRLKGCIRMAADFDAPLPPSLLRAFRGDAE